MDLKVLAAVNVACECGQKQQILMQNLSYPFECHGCGETVQFTNGQLAPILDSYVRTLKETARQLQDGDAKVQAGYVKSRTKV